MSPVKDHPFPSPTASTPIPRSFKYASALPKRMQSQTLIRRGTSLNPSFCSPSSLCAAPSFLSGWCRTFQLVHALLESDLLLENKPFGPETYFFCVMDASIYTSFCELLLATEPSVQLLHVNPTAPGDRLLCIAVDLGWVSFLFKFVLDYNLTFGQGKTIVTWHGQTPPASIWPCDGGRPLIIDIDKHVAHPSVPSAPSQCIPIAPRSPPRSPKDMFAATRTPTPPQACFEPPRSPSLPIASAVI
ncbi:hypothetical protein PhCBS80983_g06392 [Powellomyces hirtus]|uniref:Uncharacterized protein n=1 Tax=Powellomyces hirtus TaxID=109895 RepID=A0A507DMP7_9FUNG|nr:hypothetical protein PhCBS80983_g06392 [Powellomyces hirtus]